MLENTVQRACSLIRLRHKVKRLYENNIWKVKKNYQGPSITFVHANGKLQTAVLAARGLPSWLQLGLQEDFVRDIRWPSAKR